MRDQGFLRIFKDMRHAEGNLRFLSKEGSYAQPRGHVKSRNTNKGILPPASEGRERFQMKRALLHDLVLRKIRSNYSVRCHS